MSIFKATVAFAGRRSVEGSWGRRANGEEEQLLAQELPPGLPTGGADQNENPFIDSPAAISPKLSRTKPVKTVFQERKIGQLLSLV